MKSHPLFIDRALKSQWRQINWQAWRLLIAFFIVLFALLPLVCVAEEPLAENPLPRILRDWAKRRQEVGLVTYRFSGTRTWPRGAFTEEALPPPLKPGYVQETPPFSKPSAEDYLPVTNAPPEENPLQDVTGVIKSTVTLDFNNNRCRLEWDAGDYNNLSKQVIRYRSVEVGSEGIRRVNILESDNSNLSRTNSRVEFMIATGEQKLIPRSGRFEDFLPICFASGIVPVGNQYVKSVDVSPAIDTAAFRFEGYAMEAGRRVVHLSAESSGYIDIRNDFWVDLERDSAIVKLVTKMGSALDVLDIEHKLVNGSWLPKHWTQTYTIRRNDHPVIRRTESVTVSEVVKHTRAVPEAFALNPTPGMLVIEEDYQFDPKTVGWFSRGGIVRSIGYRLREDGGREEQKISQHSWEGIKDKRY